MAQSHTVYQFIEASQSAEHWLASITGIKLFAERSDECDDFIISELKTLWTQVTQFDQIIRHFEPQLNLASGGIVTAGVFSGPNAHLLAADVSRNFIWDVWSFADRDQYFQFLEEQSSVKFDPEICRDNWTAVSNCIRLHPRLNHTEIGSRIRRERTAVVDNLQQTVQSKNGPRPPKFFDWNNIEMEFTKSHFALISYMWTSRTTSYDELKERVWGKEVGDDAIEKAVTRTNDIIRECEVYDLYLSVENRYVTFKVPSPTK